MAKIIGPGSLMADITGYAQRLPSGGETAIGDFVRTSPGGKGSNQITAAKRAGADALLIGCIGDDSASEILKNFYSENNISAKYIKTCIGINTGTAIIEIDKTDAQNRILIIRGANLMLTENDVLSAENDFCDSDVVLTQLEIPNEPIIASAQLAQKYKKPFILNPAPYREIPQNLLELTDYITPNETEAEMLTGIHIENIEDAKKASVILLSFGVKNVIITLGVNGVFYTDGTNDIIIDGIKVKAVETTGAGDAFNGGFATAIGEGMSIIDALQFANCTAALSVTRLGATQSMPQREEIDKLKLQIYGN